MASQGNSPVTLQEADDAELKKASHDSRQTFRYFWRELAWEYRRIIPALDLACVKVAFRDPEGSRRRGDGPAVEQMWVSDVMFDGQKVSGTLLNEPNWLTSVKAGDEVQVPPKEVNDWMYAIDGKVFGAYTVNLIRSRMGRSERSQHDKAWGLDFGDPKSIRIVPSEYVHKKPAGFLGKMFGGEKPITLAEIEASEHPMAIAMGSSLEEMLTENPANVHEADDRGFTNLHSLSLAGTHSGVKILLKHGANPNAVTKNGMTPLRLAKSLGWIRVIQVLEQAGAK